MSVLEGIWVHMEQIDEPEERKSMKSATAEVQEVRRDNNISVVTEIKDGGMPWEGGGGYPKTTGKPNGAAVAAKVAPKVAPKAAPTAEPEPEAEAGLMWM